MFGASIYRFARSVLSYASAPEAGSALWPDLVSPGSTATESSTCAFDATCFRDLEAAGLP